MGQLYLCRHQLPWQLYGPTEKAKHIHTHQYQHGDNCSNKEKESEISLTFKS